eukprot:TRINITY_DN3792_c0_g2_i2.p1 TRINITY_DN3792_c0_g2~~TRINITY_DN3792_c0_g2_i2.p1  ORF type:complete len:117 (-),score=28.13 TRINITY_DN3792_c0_g2_i2:117-467(-)
MQADGIDILAVDAEGLDFEIVKSFLEVPKFNPQILLFEVAHMGSRHRECLLELLAQRGYSFARLKSLLREEDELADVVAWRSPLVGGQKTIAEGYNNSNDNSNNNNNNNNNNNPGQ